MFGRTAFAGAACALMLSGAIAQDAKEEQDSRAFTDTFAVEEKDLATTGRNPYFILEPGHQVVLENEKKKEVITITVLDETKKVAGIDTRIVEEKESVDGREVEVSRNYFAICRRTNSVYYFGEDAGGAWAHGERGARFGLMMPGVPLLGARYHQEIAPGVAMDRAEILSISDTFETPAGKFERVLRIEETSPLEPGEKSIKRYAPGVGMIQDGGCKLVRHGRKNIRFEKLAEEAKIGVVEAVAKAARESADGVPVSVRLMREKERAVFVVRMARGEATMQLTLDAGTGGIIDRKTTDRSRAKALAATKLTLAQAIDAALKKVPGRVVGAHLELEGAKALFDVLVLTEGRLRGVEVDGVSGAIIEVEDEDDDDDD